MMSTVTLLGTGTCQIEHERRASSVLLDLDGTHILFDCGHGTVQRLLDVGVHPNTLQYVVLSHFHPDHVSDLIPLFQAGAWSRTQQRSTDLHIYGPKGTHRLIDSYIHIFGRNAFEQPTYSLIVHEISETSFTIDTHTFKFMSLPPAGNHGLRFLWNDKTYALTGDSYFHPQEIDFLRGVDLAVIDSGHIEDDEIISLAVASQAKCIVCSHLYRELDAKQLQEQAALKKYEGTIVVGHDLMTFVL
ncbi:MAG: MBL fold metallo-hydrolase [Ktedonobacteraceae bacterium]